jgi:hypothetical protein
MSRAKAEARLAAVQARQYSGRARDAAVQARQYSERAREVASAQFTPLARSAQLSASRGLYNARVWAAPRVERTGVAVQERLAPKVSSMMVATARRMEPAPARSRRRWPAVIAGIVMLGAAAAAGGLLRSQRAAAMMNKSDEDPQPPAPMPSAGSAEDSRDVSDAAQTDVNGQVRTS